jgi:hypothetical protein
MAAAFIAFAMLQLIRHRRQKAALADDRRQG